MIRKDIIVTALLTFCLTAASFMVATSKSQEYNPWADINGDGKIDILDVVGTTGIYGTTGNPTKNVNVTNPRSKTIESTLNITLDWNPYSPEPTEGNASTDVFDTEGYDRMYVSMATLDTSIHEDWYNFYAGLNVVFWHWGAINGVDLTRISEFGYQTPLSVSTSGNALPALATSVAEIAVQAAKCSLNFNGEAEDWGWILIHVSIYLTSGSTLQDTFVTNWPEPLYKDGVEDLNVSINSGSGSGSFFIFTGGYSRLFVDSISIWGASYHGSAKKTTVSLSGIGWDYGHPVEVLPLGTLNVTYDGISYFADSAQPPPEFKTKSMVTYLYFTVSSELTVPGWIYFYVSYYFRNE